MIVKILTGYHHCNWDTVQPAQVDKAVIEQSKQEKGLRVESLQTALPKDGTVAQTDLLMSDIG